MEDIDISTLQPGDTVHFRFGGCAVVDRAGSDYADSRCCYISLEGYETEKLKLWYSRNGFYFYRASPFDIIRIERAPFDWDTVKQGMAFKNGAGKVYIYIAPNIHVTKDMYPHLFWSELDFKYVDAIFPSALTRAPEYDREV